MSKFHRCIQPAATACITLALLLTAIYLRPTEVYGVAKAIPEPGPQPQTAQLTSAPTTVQTVDTTVETILLTAFVSGLMLLLIGSLALIWHRARPAGRHRAST